MIHTRSHVLFGEDRRRSVTLMERQTRSLAYDLVDTDLEDPVSVTAFVVAHTVAPARAAWGLPAPRSGEGRSFLVEREKERPDGLLVQYMRNWRLEESTRAFDPLVRGLLLFAWLFPQSVFHSERAEGILDHPGWSVLDDSMALMGRPYEAIDHLVAGLLGMASERPFWTGSHAHVPVRNEIALAELLAAQQLVEQALDPVSDDPDTYLIDIGLHRIAWGVAREIDEIVRSEVRRRLVWFGSFEPEIVINGDGDPDVGDGIISLERGVFAADVPETIRGLVMLDLTEQFGHDHETARCARCGLLMRLTAHQKSRARLRRPVYHPGCRDEQRLVYFRRKSKERYRRSRFGATLDAGAES